PEALERGGIRGSLLPQVFRRAADTGWFGQNLSVETKTRSTLPSIGDQFGGRTPVQTGQPELRSFSGRFRGEDYLVAVIRESYSTIDTRRRTASLLPDSRFLRQSSKRLRLRGETSGDAGLHSGVGALCTLRQPTKSWDESERCYRAKQTWPPTKSR